MSSLLRQSAGSFSVVEHQLEALLAEQLATRTGQWPSPAERRSWSRSLPALAADLISAGDLDRSITREVDRRRAQRVHGL